VVGVVSAGQLNSGETGRRGPSDLLCPWVCGQALSHRRTDERGSMRLFAAVDLEETARRTAADTARDLVQSLRRVVSPPFPIGVFTVSLAEVRAFSYSGAPRVVWLGMEDGQDVMLALKTELDRRFVSVGFEREARVLRVHLTLGCVKRPPGDTRGALDHALADFRLRPGRWTVDHLTSFESQLTFRGATYHPLEAIRLASG